MAKNKLELIIAGDAKGALRAFSQAGAAGDTFGNKMKGIAKHAALLGGAAIVSGIAAVGVGLYKAFEPANRLQAQMEKTNIVFGDSVGIVKTWASENARAMGMGATAVAGLAANMGDLLIPMGFTRDVAADMSTKMTGLSGALSSWTGGTKSAAEVAVVLQKSLLGNRDGLSELGIKIMDSDVKLRMLANGTSEYTGQLREQAVAQATMELIFEKSTDAQNAFKDSTVTNYEKMLMLKGMFEEVKEKVLTALIPVYEKILSWSLDNWPKIESAVTTAFGLIGDAMNWIKDDVIPPLVEAFRKIRSWVDENKEEIKAFWSDVQEAASTMYAFIVGTVIPILVEKLGGMYDDSKKSMTDFKQLFDNVTAAVGALDQKVGSGSDFSTIGTLISTAVNTSLAPLKLLWDYTVLATKGFNDLVAAIQRYNNTTPKAHSFAGGAGPGISTPAKPAHSGGVGSGAVHAQGLTGVDFNSVTAQSGSAAKTVVKQWDDASDELVGHSIIPDMVDAVIAEMKRMKGGVTDANKAMLDGVRDRVDDLEDHVRDGYENMRDTALDSLDDERDALLAHYDEVMADARAHFSERTRLAEEAADKDIAALYRQLDAIDEAEQARQDAEKVAEMDDLRKRAKAAKDPAEKAKSLAELANLQESWADEQQRRALQDQKDAIRDQIDERKAQLDIQRAAIEADESKALDSIQKQQDVDIASWDVRKKAAEAYWKSMLSDQNVTYQAMKIAREEMEGEELATLDRLGKAASNYWAGVKADAQKVADWFAGSSSAQVAAGGAVPVTNNSTVNNITMYIQGGGGAEATGNVVVGKLAAMGIA